MSDGLKVQLILGNRKSEILLPTRPMKGDDLYLYLPDELGPHGSQKHTVTGVALTPGGKYDMIVWAAKRFN